MTITIRQTKVMWEKTTEEGTMTLWAVQAEDGKTYKTWSKPIGSASPGASFEVVVYDKTERNGETVQYIKQAPRPRDGRSFTPRNLRIDALNAAAVVVNGLLPALGNLDTTRAQEMWLELAESGLKWLEAGNASTQLQTPVKNDSEANAPQAKAGGPWDKWTHGDSEVSAGDLNETFGTEL